MIMPFNFTQAMLTQKPNQYLVCPENYCKAPPNKISPIFNLTATQLTNKLNHIIAQMPRTTLIKKDDKQQYFFYEQRSKIFKFPDYITVQIIPINTEQSSLAIYSQSKYGYYDFNVNQERVETWLNQLKDN